MTASIRTTYSASPNVLEGPWRHALNLAARRRGLTIGCSGCGASHAFSRRIVLRGGPAPLTRGALGPPFTDLSMRQSAAAVARYLGAAVICWLAVRVVAAIRYPFGGGEFHAIFAYPDGSVDVARGVFLTYLATSVAIASLLVLLGYRISWWAIAAVASLVCLDAWWQVCSFEYNLPEVRSPAMWLLPVIPVVTTVIAYLAHWGRGLA
jgi:hypothetical protein